MAHEKFEGKPRPFIKQKTAEVWQDCIEKQCVSLNC